MKYYILFMSIVISACSSSPSKTTTPNNDKKSETAQSKTAQNQEKSSAVVKTESPVTKETPKSASPNTESSTLVTCIYGSVKRELKINQAIDKCTVEYVKDGNSQEIATGIVKSPFCVEIMERVKNNLTTAGYKCE